MATEAHSDPPRSGPIELFREWLAAAHDKEHDDPTAMTLATVGPTGAPSARMMLLKGVDESGFVFYTNIGSRKGVELEAGSRAALVFHWQALRRQVRVEGTVERVSDEDADAYFATRPRGSQIGAWASDQSRPLSGRFELEKQVAQYAAKFGGGPIPRPEFWRGFRVVPVAVEFWTNKPFRLHERVLYQRGDDGWSQQRLFP